MRNFDILKKVAVILLLLIYGSASMGATVQLHYCMDEFVGWTLFNNKGDTCGKCGMEEKDKEGCCKDEHRHFKLKVDQLKYNDAQQSTVFITAPILFTDATNVAIHSYQNISESFPSCNAPPGTSKEKLNIFHCVFRI